MKFFKFLFKTKKTNEIEPLKNEISLDDKWISVKSWGDGWSGEILYINPAQNKAKIHSYKITHWGYHDECEKDEYEEIISIERALKKVYPDEEAISIILNNSNEDYAEARKKLIND